MAGSLAVVSDFDGTISRDDFFWLIADKYFDAPALEPWNLYLRGEMSHLDALNAIFSQIRLPEEELYSFIESIVRDKSFVSVAEYCFRRHIPIYICSRWNIKLITNHGVYDAAGGLKMIPPYDSEFYDARVGISKAGVVQSLKRQGYDVVFAGDGPPDFAPAQIADVVFAKKILLEKCLEANIKTQPFETFDDVYAYLQGG